ncbi:hypothetical protein PENSPDRAFT_688813 [Peniophora sp. CONT]|nr:hypothetical protein PENSPDRAFT_688813 [Peniophora sp. CONT]
MLLVDLPSDILELICGELDAHSAVACGRVCKRLHHIITTSLPVRYTIALAMRGMRPGNNESIDIGERLKLLERYEAAWLEGHWKKSFRITLPEPMAFVNHPAGKFHVHHADGYLLTWDLATGQVHVVRLPSPLRGITLEEHHWQFTSPPDPHRLRTEVLLDAQNDTVVFVEVAFVGQHSDPGRYQRVTLRPFDLSSGNVAESILPNESIVLVENNFFYTNFSLRNEFIIMRLEQPKHAGMGIVVYNWVTQRKVMKHVAFITFLDDTRIIAGFLRALEPGRDPYLRIYDLSADGSARATHDLPLPTRPNFIICGGSYMGRDCGYPSTYSGAYERAQYFSEDDWAMIYLCTDAQEGKGWDTEASYKFEMYVSTTELKRLVTENAASTSPDTITIPWSTWGHAAAIALDSVTARFGKVVSDVAGSRNIRWDRSIGALWMHDCHPARVRRAIPNHKHLIKRDDISDVGFLREDELQQPSSPVAPRTLERVNYAFFLVGSDNKNTNYNAMLCGDVILVQESEASDPYGLKAIVAYSLV